MCQIFGTIVVKFWHIHVYVFCVITHKILAHVCVRIWCENTQNPVTCMCTFLRTIVAFFWHMTGENLGKVDFLANWGWVGQVGLFMLLHEIIRLE